MLFGDDKWVLPGSGYPHQGYAVSLVSKYSAELLGKMTTGQPIAVHFDVEPYALPQWKTHRSALASDYVTLVTKLANAAHAIGLKLSVDVPYWYSTIPVKNGSVTTPLDELVIQTVDDYVIMDYWDTASRMESQATTDLTYADGIEGKAVVIGALTILPAASAGDLVLQLDPAERHCVHGDAVGKRCECRRLSRVVRRPRRRRLRRLSQAKALTRG